MTQVTNGRCVVGASVRGAVHRRDGLPNQDAIAWAGPTGPTGTLVVAVSDGHGGHKSFRSATGARFAVDAAVEIGRGLAVLPNAEMIRTIADEACHMLAEEIVTEWTTLVCRDLDRAPLTEGELAELEAKDGAAAREAVECDRNLAYGATLIVVMAFETFVMFLQLGDGDILVIPPSGEAMRPMADDSRLFGNATTSLCMSQADREFRFAMYVLPEGETTVVLVATDGLGNAYPDEVSFLRVGSDLVAQIRGEGIDRVASQLEGYLEEASAHSGDDVTVAVVCLGADAGSGTAR